MRSEGKDDSQGSGLSRWINDFPNIKQLVNVGGGFEHSLTAKAICLITTLCLFKWLDQTLVPHVKALYPMGHWDRLREERNTGGGRGSERRRQRVHTAGGAHGP